MIIIYVHSQLPMMWCFDDDIVNAGFNTKCTDTKQCRWNLLHTRQWSCVVNRRLYWRIRLEHASRRHCQQGPLSSVSTTRVDGWLVSITRQHGPCWRVMETSHPSTRAVNSGSGNRALVITFRLKLSLHDSLSASLPIELIQWYGTISMSLSIII